jgi:NAD(P)-dependent dehydrogenase (short-subunit alcohol dehydrogenase family)
MRQAVSEAASATDHLFRLDGQVAWVTGASRGLGRAIAIGLAQAGARLAVTARDEEELATLAKSLNGVDVLCVPGSVTDSGGMTDAVAQIQAEFGQLDILVNMAGISPTVCRSEETTDHLWEQVIGVNLTGTFYCCRAAAALMLPAGSGSIITVSSVHGSTGIARMAAYGASKGAIENLTRSLAIEWATQGVRVNCLAPGYIRTDLTAAYLDSRYGERVRAGIPMGRAGNPEDLVGAAIFLAGPASAYVTGSILPVDGGWTAQ